jgi:single-strand DNA-binding protein
VYPIVITVVGNLTRDPVVRFLADGTPMCSFTVATTPRFFEPAAAAWRDSRPVFLRCSAWRRYAENISATLGRGMRVIVTGELRRRRYTTPEGALRSIADLRVHEAAPSLAWAVARVARQAPGEPPPMALPAPAVPGPGPGPARPPAPAGAAGDPPF